jgi:hypothetical protein
MHPLSTAQNTLLRAGRRPKNAVQLGEQIGGYLRSSFRNSATLRHPPPISGLVPVARGYAWAGRQSASAAAEG